MSERVFLAEYDKSDVALRVWLPLGGAAILGMGGLLIGLPMLSLLAAALTLLALNSWPLTRNVPALLLTNKGLEIDGLGKVSWRNITRVDSGVVNIRDKKRPAIDLTFASALPEVFEANETTRLRPWEIRIYKLRKDGKMRLDLSRIEDSPEELLEAFRHFHAGVS